MTGQFGWTPTQIDDMTFANLLVYCKDKPAGMGMVCGPGDFGALVQKLRREKGLI